MKKGRLVSIALSCIVAAGLFAVPTNAKSAQAGASVEPAYFEGVTSSEIILLNEQTQVEVEKEKLTFHAEQLPKPYATDDYKGTVRAEYTLYNPSSEDGTLHLALPLGNTRNYYYECVNRKVVDEYVVTADGEDVETRLRHSYLYEYDNPSAENFTYVPEMFHADTPVHNYSYTVTLPAGYDTEKNWLFCAELYYNPQNTVLLASDIRNIHVENGNELICFWLRDGVTTCQFHFAGEDGLVLSSRIESWDGEVQLDNTGIVSTSKTVSTFAEYAGKSPYEEVCDEDWQRICGVYAEYSPVYGSSSPCYEELYRYAEYQITVPAGGRVTHTVETPLIPTTRGDKSFYAYDFDGARAWANYGTLNVEIYAGSAPNECTLNLVSGDGVFTHGRSNLPMGDLRFSLGEYEESGWTNNANDWKIALIILAVLAVVAAGVVVITVMVRRKRLRTLEMRAEAEAQAKKENIEKSDEEEKK